MIWTWLTIRSVGRSRMQEQYSTKVSVKSFGSKARGGVIANKSDEQRPKKQKEGEPKQTIRLRSF